MSRRFTITHLTDNQETNVLHDVAENQCYTLAKSFFQEGFAQSQDNRWHIMLSNYANEEIAKLEIGQELCIAWEDPLGDLPVQRVLITRQEDGMDVE
jgi:hypothetical protein